MDIDDLIERLIRIRENHGSLEVVLEDDPGWYKEPQWEVKDDMLVLK